MALIFLILGKYSFLSTLAPGQVWRWLIVAHTASRWMVLQLCAWLPYAWAEGQGKLVAKQSAYRTAEIIAEHNQLSVQLSAAWREINMGMWEGRTPFALNEVEPEQVASLFNDSASFAGTTKFRVGRLSSIRKPWRSSPKGAADDQ